MELKCGTGAPSAYSLGETRSRAGFIAPIRGSLRARNGADCAAVKRCLNTECAGAGAGAGRHGVRAGLRGIWNESK